MKSKTLRCRQVRRLMHQFLDGELPTDQTHLVAAHLEVCDECGLEATTVEAVMEMLRALQQPTDDATMVRLDAFAERVAAGGAA